MEKESLRTRLRRVLKREIKEHGYTITSFAKEKGYCRTAFAIELSESNQSNAINLESLLNLLEEFDYDIVLRKRAKEY